MAFINAGTRTVNAVREAQLRDAQRAETEEQRQLLEQRRQARERLAQRFGPGAADPQGLVAAQRGEARQTRAELAEEAQDFEQDIIRNEERRRAALNLVRGGMQSLDNGAPPEQVLQDIERLAPTVGANEADIQTLRQGFAEAPRRTLESFEAALAGGGGQEAQLPANIQEFQFLSQLANDPNIDPATQRAAQVELGVRSRAGQSEIVDINGVPTAVEIGPSGEVITSDSGRVVRQDAQGNLTLGPQRQRQLGPSTVQQTPLSTRRQEDRAARNRERVRQLGSASADIDLENAEEIRQNIRRADNTITATRQISDVVEGEPLNTGAFGNVRQEIARTFADFTGADLESVQNTDAFISRAGKQVADLLERGVLGSRPSDRDLSFLQEVQGASGTLSPESILTVQAILEKQAIEGKVSQARRRQQLPADVRDRVPEITIQRPSLSEFLPEGSEPARIPEEFRRQNNGQNEDNDDEIIDVQFGENNEIILNRPGGGS